MDGKHTRFKCHRHRSRGVNGCRRKHHPLPYPNQNIIKTEIHKNYQEEKFTNKKKKVVDNVWYEETGEALLKILPVEIEGPTGI